MSETTRGTVNIGTMEDPYSFLIPCWGFKSPDEDIGYARSEDYLRDHGLVSGETYSTFHTGGTSTGREYVPLIGSHGHELNTTSFLNRTVSTIKIGRPGWHILWRSGKEKPQGAYNVALLIGGARRFRQEPPASAGLPSKLLRRLMTTDADCYAVWGYANGTEMSNSTRIRFHEENGVHVARYGQGVLVAVRTNFDYTGAVTHYQIGLVQIEFSIIDKDPRLDDKLKVTLTKRNWVFAGSEEEVFGRRWREEMIEGQDRGWKQLIERAILGFERHCRLTRLEVDEWRKFFLEQRRKADADRATYNPTLRTWQEGNSFHRSVRATTWQEALMWVQEPWQLQLVIEAHCDECFDEFPNRHDSTGSRVRRMLDQHQCSPERREQLWKWIDQYVRPADDMWEYTRD